MTMFQHMKSTDPAAVSSIEDRQRAWNETLKRAQEWCAKYGGEGFAHSTLWGVFCVRGLRGDEKPTEGRWREDKSGLFVPYRNTPAWNEMQALQAPLPSIAGIPNPVRAAVPGEGFSFYALTPKVFVVDGVAYASFSMPPSNDDENIEVEAAWEECLSSEFKAAEEQWIEIAEAAVARETADA